MRWVRSVLVGILFWVLIFVEVSIVQFGLGVDGITGRVIHYILLIPIGVFCAWLYYKSEDKVNGFVLGLWMVVLGIILDLVITVPVFLGMDYGTFYSDPLLWIGFLVAVVVVGVYDILRKK